MSLRPNAASSGEGHQPSAALSQGSTLEEPLVVREKPY